MVWEMDKMCQRKHSNIKWQNLDGIMQVFTALISIFLLENFQNRYWEKHKLLYLAS